MPEPVTMDLKKAKIYFLDGATSPTKLEVHVDEGNLTYTRRRNIEYRKDRGLLDHVREGDEEPMDVSLEARFNAVKSQTGNPITLTEFLEQEGAGSSLVTTGGPCEPYSIDIHVEIDQDCGTTSDEIVKFEEFRFEEIGGDFRAGTLSITGKCNRVKPTSELTTLS